MESTGQGHPTQLGSSRSQLEHIPIWVYIGHGNSNLARVPTSAFERQWTGAGGIQKRQNGSAHLHQLMCQRVEAPQSH